MLTECQGIILCNSRVYIPEGLRVTYLEIVHEGHQGVVKWFSSSIKQFMAERASSLGQSRTSLQSGLTFRMNPGLRLVLMC